VHRCWLGEIGPLTVGETVALSPEESAHVARVLRMKPDETVQLIAAERLYEGKLSQVDQQAVTVRVLMELPTPEAVVHVTLVQGLPKLDKMEWIIQKATELGVWDILPVEMERSVARLDEKEPQKRERWTRIALEASKQSGRAHVPEILPARKLAQAVSYLKTSGYDAVFVAWEEEGETSLSHALQKMLALGAQPRAVAIIIGPEGGIGAVEIEKLKEAGAECVTLGKRILRTETAGLCALVVTMSTFGEM